MADEFAFLNGGYNFGCLKNFEEKDFILLAVYWSCGGALVKLAKKLSYPRS